MLPTLIQLLDGRDDKVHEIRRRGRAVRLATTPQRRPARSPPPSLLVTLFLHPQRFHPDNPPHTTRPATTQGLHEDENLRIPR